MRDTYRVHLNSGRGPIYVSVVAKSVQEVRDMMAAKFPCATINRIDAVNSVDVSHIIDTMYL